MGNGEPPPAYQQPAPYPYTQQPPPQAGATVVTTTTAPAILVPMTGNCPSCRVGHLIEGYTACGIIWAICCFPCGLICLFSMKEKKCGMCGAVIN